MLTKIILINLLYWGIYIPVAEKNSIPDCKSLEPELTITHTTNSLDNGKLNIKLNQDIKTELHLLHKNTRENKNKLQIVGKEIEGIKAGEYLLIVRFTDNEEYCPYHIRVEIR
ncbi:MAG TPA: hypothetical protein PKC24_14580 [Cyclobacteriaceae bacterium]|nr:hypothetical protein [Cyclobacteriaceae bacterium]